MLVEKNKIDDLTGVYTKKATLDFVDNTISRKPDSELSILLIDIDNSKQINDAHGHIAGDN